ncbi:MAG TPA: efflux RND transporter periplasmic adaptor subunit [Edaphobacter sp.]|nr:efflux RND transporter periplasmic adaptor subunit [Edaphobacter sp.]
MPTTETRRLNPFMLWAIFLVVAILVFVVVRSSARDTLEIRVAPVSRQNLISSVPTTGKVEPIDEFQAYAPAPGVIAKVYVKVLQKVKVGDLLLKMDDSDIVAKLATANATLRTAEATLHDLEQGGSQEEHITLTSDLARAQQQQQQATKDLAALKQLEQRGAASASEVIAAEQRLQTANSSVQSFQLRSTQRYSPTDKARVEAQVNDARAALAAAQSSYDSFNIRTPKAGTVYSTPVSTYDFVSAGETLVAVADLNKIQIHAYFDEPEIGKLAVGQAVKIAWDAKPNQTWHGHISVAPTSVITYGTRYVGECIVTVDDARGDLLPNTNVVVTVTTAQRTNALSVPREALHTEGGDFVYRVVNNKLVRTPVQVGLVNLTRAEITGGLTEKDTVALNAINNRELSNGVSVKIVD